MKESTITIFGSSVPQEDDKEYTDAYYIAKKLSSKGFNICSGGSLGIMDAVSKAAFEEGRKAIGVTVKIFNSRTSDYLTEEIKCETLYQRLENLLGIGDAFIILPGGTGTLLELSLVWELFNKNVTNYKPAVCFGEIWKNIVEIMENRIKEEQRCGGLIHSFTDPDEMVEYLIEEIK